MCRHVQPQVFVSAKPSTNSVIKHQRLGKSNIYQCFDATIIKGFHIMRIGYNCLSQYYRCIAERYEIVSPMSVSLGNVLSSV